MFFRVPARVVTPIEERNEGEETSGGKSKIVSRDASVVGSNLGRGTRANPNPAYPESNFESFESDPLLSSPASLVQGGIPRGRERERERTGVVGPRDRSRILSPLEGPHHPWNRTFPPSLSYELPVTLSAKSSCFSRFRSGEISKEKWGVKTGWSLDRITADKIRESEKN